MRFAVGVALLLSLPGCGDAGDSGTAPVANDHLAQSHEDAPPQPAMQLNRADQERVCRTAIADLNGHPPAIVTVTGSNEGIIRLRYARPSDGKLWTNECMIDGGRVVWRTVDASGPESGPGRWRTDPMDEVLTYSVEGNRIGITTTFPGEAPSTKTYTVR